MTTDNQAPLHRNAEGKLDAIAFTGGYSIRYLCEEGETVCAECANEWTVDEYGTPEPIEAYIDWEGSGVHCAHCNKFLPSEYGDPDTIEA